MKVLDDIKIKQELWKEEYLMYYQDRMDSGDFIILKFTAKNRKYCSNFHMEDFEIA
ncbi:MAG: hypothetical protein LBD84_05495 [Campylobacteraceae bacterium]|jgi:general stress protein 26|nr:hypothetical protein [Campylobacteraceae bacterium]